MDPENHNYLTDCPTCRGEGFIGQLPSYGDPHDTTEICPICKGAGKLNANQAQYIQKLQDEILGMKEAWIQGIETRNF